MNQNIRKFLVVYKEKDEIIEEKNRSIDLLQQKLKKIEQKAQEKTLNESQNKDTPKQLLHKKLYDIEETIESEKRKKITFIVLCILFLTLSI